MDLSKIEELHPETGESKFLKSEVLDLYYRVLCNSYTWDLGLGYFSLSSIRLLAFPIAKFILNNNGKIRLYCNEKLSEYDYNTLASNKTIPLELTKITSDLKNLADGLEGENNELFKDCIAFLIQSNRLEIKVLVPRTQSSGIAHQKNSIFKDDKRNTVVLSGAANASEQAFLFNREDTNAFCSFWNQSFASKNIRRTIRDFERTFNQGDESWKILQLKSKELKDHINKVGFRIPNKKELQKSIDKFNPHKNSHFSKNIQKEIELERISISDEPHFPFFDGKISTPRAYQEEAYRNWIRNDYTGVFAMATGTGKTITSLNCLLNIYNDTGNYRAIILVPSIALLNQWEKEVKAFNFKKILKVGGGNNWEKELATYVSNYNWGIKDDLIIISTYGSFVTDKFFKYFRKIDKELIMIADEAHNMGANNIRSKFNEIKTLKKIGLSATPDRIYDQVGTEALNNFFNDSPPYTYSFDMERALNEGFLTEYKYFPKIVELTTDEFDVYLEISKKLLKFFDFETGQFKNDPIVEILLLQRKNIIHKAVNKIACYKTILKELKKLNKLSYVFTYVPEGYVYYDNTESERIIDRYILAGSDVFPNLKANTYTSDETNLKDLLRGFSEGRIDLLYAMKMLDEGVDVPRAEVGIFCSSTGNPRQFIQRRGRLLRKHQDKTFATIYDMVVIPSLSTEISEHFNMERNLVVNEIRRVAHFASLSMNYYDTKKSLENVLNKYNINLDEIINEL